MSAFTMTFAVLVPKAKKLEASTAVAAVTARVFVVRGAQAETQMATASALVKPREDAPEAAATA